MSRQYWLKFQWLVLLFFAMPFHVEVRKMPRMCFSLARTEIGAPTRVVTRTSVDVEIGLNKRIEFFFAIVFRYFNSDDRK
jgi:hypothetical protein